MLLVILLKGWANLVSSLSLRVPSLRQTLIMKLWKHECWRKVIQCEISALDSNQTWEKTTIGCK